MSPSLLRLEGVTVRFGGVVGLEDVGITLAEGEVVAVVGALGAGKSTLLRVAAGALRPDAGRVTFAGGSLAGRPPGEAARRGVLLVPAGGGIFPTLTVRENLELADEPGRTFPSDDVEALFGRFPILSARPAQVAGSLSGGEQRQLAIARAALGRPRVLLLDEPLLGLAPQVSTAVAGLITELGAAGTAVLVAEERPTETLSGLATRLIGIRLGRIVPAVELAGAAAIGLTRDDPPRNDRIESQAVRIPLSVADKRALQTMASANGETVGELLARLAREHVASRAQEVE